MSLTSENYGSNQLEKNYVLNHLDFFVNLYALKIQYNGPVGKNKVDYMDIICENNGI